MSAADTYAKLEDGHADGGAPPNEDTAEADRPSGRHRVHSMSADLGAYLEKPRGRRPSDTDILLAAHAALKESIDRLNAAHPSPGSAGGMKSLAETYVAVATSARKSAEMHPATIVAQGFAAGAYLSFGGLLAITVGGGMPSIAASDPGLEAFAFAAVFPFGLMLVVFMQAELFTGNAAKMTAGWLAGTVSARDVGINWACSFLGNFLGSVLFALVLVRGTDLLSSPAQAHLATLIAAKKTAHSYLPTLLRGIGANWLVCLAVWTATASHGVPGKAIALWFPTMAFVCSGFEHCVANMFIIPNGMLLGAPVSVGDFLLGNLLPAAMGNVIGGAAMVAGLTFVPAGRPNLARAD